MIKIQVDNENPNNHWKFIECEGKVALDLGCGRWEKMEHRDPSWPTTPEYLKEKGATKVYAFDTDPEEVNWFNENIDDDIITTQNRMIETVEDVRDLLSTYKPTVIKCDIEMYERTFLELTKDEFRIIEHFAVETHNLYGNTLHEQFIEKFKEFDYEITAEIDLTHAPPMNVLFANKK
jgi:hypothetical protein